uniref:Zinc finger C2H2 LYAR-type domain-containing protein n=1 Tax=Arcella intermedia TaxID=1963864 RepID=A0A6B2LIB8_9EUKA|eukprot:TRINITY_DN27431_c0_g1_i1.p1 TRINITY_DN27431_c0_g1~~TRINITY_DN27431_c0_g1_i1.p1  ORF type:complete len:208 (-),score=61.99 TRINITY_DN27431_c0_g1_i1:2-625(-)
MVSFVCDACQTTVTKPKVKLHLQRCHTNRLSCIDCNQVFDQNTVHQHTQCITEAEKWHGKFAKKKGNPPANTQNPPKINTTTSTTATQPPSSQAAAPKEATLATSAPSDKSLADCKKRKREEEPAALPAPQALPQPIYFDQLKWRRKTKKHLKKQGGSLPAQKLKDLVIGDLLQDIKKDLEQAYDHQIVANKKIKISDDQVSFKSNK